MSKRRYGQYCGLARALEVVGERWALLIVRDLLGGPQRFTDLLNGLPGIPTNVLASRLRELEEVLVVERRAVPRTSGGGIAYHLTELGASLEPSVDALGRWGAKLLGEPRDGETFTLGSLMAALRATFQPRAAKGVNVSYEMRVFHIVFHAIITRGSVEVAPGPLPDADLVIDAGPSFKALLARDITPAEALKGKLVRVEGDRKLLLMFVELFRI